MIASAVAPAAASAAPAVVVPIASPHDPRLYRMRTLTNGLTSMIITDKQKDGSGNQTVPGAAASNATDAAAGKKAKSGGAAAAVDASSKPAVVALSVRVGHWSDPAAIPGLAHFLEHMSEKKNRAQQSDRVR